MLAAIERGLTITDVKEMQLGTVVDFVIDYNERQKQGEEKKEHKKAVKHYRLATPEESSAFLRG